MIQSELKKLSNEELRKKEGNTKALIGVFIPILIGLLYFGIRDYNAGNIEMPITIIGICALGGLASLFPELKKIKEELHSRQS